MPQVASRGQQKVVGLFGSHLKLLEQQIRGTAFLGSVFGLIISHYRMDFLSGDLSNKTLLKSLLILSGILSNGEHNLNSFLSYKLDLTSKRMV